MPETAPLTTSEELSFVERAQRSRASTKLKTGIAVVAALAVTALAPETASGKIIEGKSINGVVLGFTEAQVESVIGTPITNLTKKLPDSDTIWTYSSLYPEPGHHSALNGYVVFDKKGDVASVSTLSYGNKTTKGIGLGSTIAAARKAYPHLKCTSDAPHTPPLDCTILTHYRGRVSVTEFLFDPRNHRRAFDYISVGWANYA
jgi:hypothetical protein